MGILRSQWLKSIMKDTTDSTLGSVFTLLLIVFYWLTAGSLPNRETVIKQEYYIFP